ncbi:UNVERIFIED_CONTAM: hypothetical protein Scaly_1024900 [Sesamum calycinum]|uniref:SWIM-type domain-containing protein n=1 Tax=Sesamum calycinum TaxID=2727403 RepID=A0AAW2QJF3_9LAMI
MFCWREDCVKCLLLHVPEALYEGGSLCKFDYVLPNEVCIESLDLFSDSVGIEKGRRYYTIVNKGFKLLIDNNDFKREWKKVLKYREMLIYVEGAVGEGVGEKNVVGEGLERRMLWVRGLEREMLWVRGMLRVEEEIVRETSESSGESSDEEEDDVVENDGDLDEHRDSDGGEGDGHSHPVFNPTKIYDPIFELGMSFTNKSFRVDIINDLRVNVSRHQACRAKKAALKEIEGSREWQYARLWDYADEVRKTNHGSTVFRAGCRPIIGIDGCHLKGPHGGILLIVVGVNPNNNLFPIAYAVVGKECRKTWEWFLILLKHDLNIVRQHEYTFMYDKQKGLIQAFEEVFPGCDHRFCVRHLHNNLKHAFKVADCMPIKADDLHYQVSCFDGNQHCVDLGEKSCSCRKWQLSGIPCKHACYAIYHQKQDPIDYVADCYSVDTYRKVYEPAIQPMSHEGLWSKSLIIPPLPPNFGRGPGHVENLDNTAKCPEREGETRSTLDQRASKKAVESKVGKRKAVDSIIEDNSNEIEHGGSSGTQYPNILPPLLTEAEPTPEACITQQETVSQPPAVPIYKAGPSMYEQVSMSNKHMTLQSRVQIRAPPPMIGPQRIPIFSSVFRAQSGIINPILTERGQKYLDLSQFSSSDAY